jgi:multisubunit Na+/H+ antiporter MnhF subunit
MELKNVIPNGDNVVASNLTNTNFFLFMKIVKIEFKNRHYMLIFL